MGWVGLVGGGEVGREVCDVMGDGDGDGDGDDRSCVRCSVKRREMLLSNSSSSSKHANYSQCSNYSLRCDSP